MKNAAIIVLIGLVVVLGVALITNNDPESSSAPTTSATQEVDTSDANSAYANAGLTTVPSAVFEDRSATVLDLSGNSLTGALPGEIRFLDRLEVLDASDNNLTGIPAEIGQLSNLRVANFANNDISGLPLEIGNLSNLEQLDLRGNPNVSEYDISLIQPKIPNAEILTD
jgi:Leucine-rich repeat (LRR) protein